MTEHLKNTLIAGLITCFLGGSLAADPATPPPTTNEIVQRYLAALSVQQDQMRGSLMEVEIDANLPKFKKSGTLHALRSISRLGQITYRALQFAGDNMIRKEVIARYMTAETQATSQQAAQIAITPENYRFKYKGLKELEGRKVYALELRPKKKRVGLFKGELWVDPETYLPVREFGTFVKNPSLFLKKTQFVRDYEIAAGIARPLRVQSLIETRLFGRAELSIFYRNFVQEEPGQPLVAAEAQTQ